MALNTEMLKFFALPFIADPKGHPEFEELFTETWRSTLMDRLDKFLEGLPDEVTMPRLYTQSQALVEAETSPNDLSSGVAASGEMPLGADVPLEHVSKAEASNSSFYE